MFWTYRDNRPNTRGKWREAGVPVSKGKNKVWAMGEAAGILSKDLMTVEVARAILERSEAIAHQEVFNNCNCSRGFQFTVLEESGAIKSCGCLE